MEKWPLTALADGLLSQALSASTGRGMCAVDGGPPHLLYQTVIAWARGERIEELARECIFALAVARLTYNRGGYTPRLP